MLAAFAGSTISGFRKNFTPNINDLGNIGNVFNQHGFQRVHDENGCSPRSKIFGFFQQIEICISAFFIIASVAKLKIFCQAFYTFTKSCQVQPSLVLLAMASAIYCVWSFMASARFSAS